MPQRYTLGYIIQYEWGMDIAEYEVSAKEPNGASRSPRLVTSLIHLHSIVSTCVP